MSLIDLPISLPYECTFKFCSEMFESIPDMISHKIHCPKHDYCAVCDEDFPDYDALVIHKIMSLHHITCPVCGEDFKSEDGQLHHVELMHASKQHIRCVGCGRSFPRAGSLMDHIEKNKCPKIPMDAVQKQRAHKVLVRAYLSNPEAFKPPHPSDAASNDELLRLGELSLLDDETSGPLTGPVLTPEPLSAADMRGRKMDWSMFDSAARYEFPTNAQDSWVNSPSAHKDAAAAAAGSQALIVPSSTPSAQPTKGTVSGLFKPSARQAQGAKAKKPAWDPKSSLFKPELFLHPITGKYVCPYPQCRSALKTLQGFKQHLTSFVHLPERITCPACLKAFKTTTALVQHCESPSNRCQIRKSGDFNEALDAMTGGLIEAQGYHADGTLKFAASKMRW